MTSGRAPTASTAATKASTESPARLIAVCNEAASSGKLRETNQHRDACSNGARVDKATFETAGLLMQHCLNFRPEPQIHGSLRPTVEARTTDATPVAPSTFILR